MEENSVHDQQEGVDFRSSAGNLMDTRTSHLDDILLEKLEDAFHKETSQVQLHSVAKIASEHSATDLAFVASYLPSSARPVVFENLPDLDSRIDFMINADKYTRTIVLREIEDREITEMLEKMPPDEAVWIVEGLSGRRFWRVIDQLEPATASRIRELQQHARNSAGRMMTNQFFAFKREVTVGEAAKYVRNNPGIDLMRWIFVVDDEGELQGFVPARNLIINPHHFLLKQVVQPIQHTVSPDATREEVIDLVGRYKIPSLPVVSTDNQLLGIITYEDVVEAMEDAADDTFALIAGTSEDLGEHDPLVKRFLLRAPWLLVTLLAGLTSAAIMLELSDRPWFLFVPFFAPLINAMSGNVGIVCSTVLVRSMATGAMSSGTKGDAIAKEITLGAITGVLFGIFCGILVYTLGYMGMEVRDFDPFIVATSLSAGVIGACITSTFIAVTAPFAFSRIGVDPAVAAGPIVTAANDVVSTCIYCLVTKFVSYIRPM